MSGAPGPEVVSVDRYLLRHGLHGRLRPVAVELRRVRGAAHRLVRRRPR